MFNLSQYKDNIAVITDKGEHLTYAELEANTHIDVPRGLVFCLCNNTLQSLIGYLTCVQNNLPVVMLDGSKPKDVIDSLMQLYRPEYIWDGELKETGLKGGPLNRELAVCLTTSGSTGSPKLVRLSARNVFSNAESIADYLGIDENERPITTLPMHYSYGLSVINSHLLRGATILLTNETYAQREFWNFVKEYKATSMSGVPYTYEILKRLRFFRMDLPYLKTMTQAGGKLNKELAREYMEFAAANHKKFIVMYGQTEATARMSYLPWECALDKYASIGIPIPGGRFLLVDPDGRMIDEDGKNGELVYYGPNVSLGYAECREDLAKGDENNGELHTGDVAYKDKEGFYYISGRLKRFAKVWGNRCNLDAVEQLVKIVTPDCACVGVDDKITIFVLEKGIGNVIINMLAEKTGLNNRAFSVIEIDTIPKSDSGKVLYPELQKLI